MSYCISQAFNTTVITTITTASIGAASRASSQWLLCLMALLCAVGNANAGINLRITLATTGLASTEASFAGSDNSRLAEQRATTAEREAKRAAQAQLRAEVKTLVKLYAAKSDQELTTLSARWQELPRLDRQVLLREVKVRMARQRGRQGSVQIRTERRFGRLLRQADGSVVRVETRVVQVRPATDGEPVKRVTVRKSAYGTGFERRSAPDPSVLQGPVTKVAGPQDVKPPAPAPQGKPSP